MIAKFKIIIKGIDYGFFNLEITHNKNINSETYLQNNSMTKLKWGDARNYIRNESLIGSILKLYKPALSTNYFIIEIS